MRCARLEELGGGVILYLAQEGRGLGLANKMRTYQLQDDGLDTVDANTTLGFDDDERDYGIAARMLQMLNCTRIVLLTNNPAKLDGLAKAGIEIAEPDAARGADQCRQPSLYDGQGGARRPPARSPACVTRRPFLIDPLYPGLATFGGAGIVVASDAFKWCTKAPH